MNLIVFGFKGAGKTTFGKKLAETLKRPFIDLDERIALHVQCPVRELYRKVGEFEFRKIEKKALRDIADSTQCVIALGGGTVLDPENVSLLLAMGKLIYLKTCFEIIEKRIGEMPPFVKHSLKQTYEERIPTYESIPALWMENDEYIG